MKKLIVLATTCLCFQMAQAQWGLQLGYQRPVGEYGIVVAPSLGVDFLRRNFTGNTVTSFSIGLYPHQTRRDVFRIYGVQSSGNTTTLLPGGQTFQLNRILYIPLAFSGDRMFLQGDFKPFLGVELNVGLQLFSSSYTIQTLITSSEDGNLTISVAPRAGFYYILPNDWIMGLGISRATGFSANETIESYYKLFFNVGSYF